jgi:hypothetical protein
MNEVAPRGGWKLKIDSYTKLIVWFKDGNTRTMYSIDWTNRYGRRDKEIGLLRIEKLITGYGINVKVAHVYDTDTGELIRKYPNVMVSGPSSTELKSKQLLLRDNENDL